jgi:lysophospholipase L1-like esterase
MIKKLIYYGLLGAVIVSGIVNLLLMVVVDRAFHYRDSIGHLENSFFNEGIRLVDKKQIRATDISPLGAFVGGGLVRYWFLPADFPFRIANWGGVEEKCQTTLKRFDDTVISSGSDFVLINAGFCDIVTAVRFDRSVSDTISSNIEYLEQMVEIADDHNIIPVLTTLTPVRPRFLLSHLKALDYSWAHKASENKAIQKYNKRIRELSRKTTTPLIDFHGALSDEDGLLRQEYAISDGEHLTYSGYGYLNGFLKSELLRIFPPSKSPFDTDPENQQDF